MRIYDLIAKKRDGGKFSAQEIDFFVRGVTDGGIADEQASAWLMAAFIRGLDAEETAWLTKSMTDSGRSCDFSKIPGIKVDKHSTGGVGDGISLALAPLVAACGVPVPMMSGRGLGHTGGTLDKLESIPGFCTQLSLSGFQKQMAKIGLAMLGQTPEIAPADKKLYALRDVTGSVESIPLITASILSKKLAEGADALVLDVKTGSGAFMQKQSDSIALAKRMVEIGKRCKKKMVALVTNMDQPLGAAVGNALEMQQAIEILRGGQTGLTKDFIELTDILGGWMLFLGGACAKLSIGQAQIAAARKNGLGLKKMRELIVAQKGDPAVCDAPEKILPKAPKHKIILARNKGWVVKMNARAVGVAATILGAGREKQNDEILSGAGISLRKKVGDAVHAREPLADFFFADERKAAEAEKIFLSGLTIGKQKPAVAPLVLQVIR